LEQHDLKTLMGFSCEPGIYIPGFGGFRHSDAVIVTDQGPDL
jgi:Xaa-Pro dipeptidase